MAMCKPPGNTTLGVENAQLRVENERLKDALRVILRDVDPAALVGLLDAQRLLRAHCHARDALAAQRVVATPAE
jgi:hypothetical protein